MQKPAIMSLKFDIDLTDSFEKIPVKIFPTPQQGSSFVAQEIALLIKEKQAKKASKLFDWPALVGGTIPRTLRQMRLLQRTNQHAHV